MIGPTLVTGATGFVGSAVARAFAARGHALRLLVRPGRDRRNIEGLAAELAEGDLTDPASLARAVAGCRFVVHVAADYRIWVPDPAAMAAANVEGTRALMRAALAAGVERVVYCSSRRRPRPDRHRRPGRRGNPGHPRRHRRGLQTKSKYDAEQAVLAPGRREGLPAVMVNPSAPVGPRDIKPTPTGRMIADAAAGRMPAYVDTGLNIVHVDDVAEGHALALERGAHRRALHPRRREPDHGGTARPGGRRHRPPPAPAAAARRRAVAGGLGGRGWRPASPGASRGWPATTCAWRAS